MKTIANLNEKRIAGKIAIVSTVAVMLASNAFAANGFYAVAEPVVKLLNSLLGPLLGIVGAVGAVYCILLGVKFAKAEEPQEREKAKSHLKNAIIGYVLIFILIAVLNLLKQPMIDWVNSTGAGNIIDSNTATATATVTPVK